MTNFLHGLNVIEVETGGNATRAVSSSVIGIIGTAPEADAEKFPLNTPVLLADSVTEAAKLGASGTLPSAVDGIFVQTGAVLIIVRIEEGEDADTTALNVIGDISDAGEYSGLQCFLIAKNRHGVAPGILVAPGFSASKEIVTEMIPIAEKLKAIVVADTPTDTDASAVQFAVDCSSSRVYAVYPEIINSKNETVPASPYVAAVIAKNDNTRGFWMSPSNSQMYGIAGLSKAVDFALGDATCKANYLNENHIATIINQDGFRLWGNRCTSKDDKHKFLCVRRTADVISESILQSHLWAVDRNIVKNYLTDVAESVNAFLANLQSQGAILDGKCYPSKKLNTSANISEGKVYFDFEFTPAYPAEHVTFRAYLNNSNIESILLENLAQR